MPETTALSPRSETVWEPLIDSFDSTIDVCETEPSVRPSSNSEVASGSAPSLPIDDSSSFPESTLTASCSSGRLVGLVVGLIVGSMVGATVGLDVGFAVGLFVGFAVGLDVGIADGLFVGFAVGLFVGFVVEIYARQKCMSYPIIRLTLGRFVDDAFILQGAPLPTTKSQAQYIQTQKRKEIKNRC